MKVIIRAIQRQGNSPKISNGPADVVIKTDFIVRSYQRTPILRGEYNVIKKVGVGVSHNSSLTHVSTQHFYQPTAVRCADSISLLDWFPGFATLTPGFMPPSAPRTP